MRAVVYAEIGGPLEVREIDRPRCPADAVLIEVRASGVCRSDWHAWRGHDPVQLPHVPGHEFAGVVAERGSDVRGFLVGTPVTAPFVCGCGRCDYCLAGDAQVCPDQTQPGFTHQGSFADFVVVRHADHNLVALPDGVDFVTAASLGCRFATAYRALLAHGGLEAGQWVAVHGCGGVGLSAIMIAKAIGARVVAVDISATALQRAAELGADVCVDSADLGSPEDIGTAVADRTGGGVDISLDALGSPTPAAASVFSLRRRGKHIQVGLLLGADSTPALPMDRVISWELSVHGSHGMAAHEYPAMLALVASGALDPAALVGRVISLEEAGIALAAMDFPPTYPGMTVISNT